MRYAGVEGLTTQESARHRPTHLLAVLGIVASGGMWRKPREAIALNQDIEISGW